MRWPRPARRVAVVTATLALVVGLPAVSPAPPTAAAAPVPSTVVLSGSGWGHGVGMSQYGARAQAEEGRSWGQILRSYYTGISLGSRRDDAEIRVNLLTTTGRVTATTTALGTGGGAFTVRVGDIRRQGGPGDTLSVVRGATGAVATIRHAEGFSDLPPGRVVVQWSGTRFLPGPATLLNVPGAGGRYRHGRVEIRQVAGTLTVVTRVRVHEEYLYGIGEMPASWHTEALKAQAVAARTVALRAAARPADPVCDCHLFDDVRSQVFTGWDVEGAPGVGARWTAAVDGTTSGATAGRTAEHGGALIEALYFSSSGGRTENSEDYFSTAQPYLRSVADPWSLRPANPNVAWQETRTRAQVATAFGLPDVVRLDLSARTAGGQVRTAVAESPAGVRASLTGRALRAAFGLRSAFVQRPAVRHAGADRWQTAVAVGRTAVPQGGGRVVLVNGTDAHLVDGLVAAPVARLLSAPVLLTGRDAVPAATMAEMLRRGTTGVFVLGGAPAVSDAVVAALARRGMNVTRIAGRDRYATAEAAARRFWSDAPAAVFAAADGPTLADALAAAGPAARTGRPVLLVRRDAVPAATQRAVGALGTQRGHCVGGPAVISEAVVRALPCQRTAGDDRFATSAAVAAAFAGSLPASAVAVVSGDEAHLVDALGAGVLGVATLLVRPTGTTGAASEHLRRALVVRTLHVVGGPPAVSDGAVRALRDA